MAPKKKISKKRAAKKTVAKKPSTMLENLLQALAGFYPDDALTPGVVLAYLPHREGLLGNDKQYYGSIARFVRKPRLDGKAGSATIRYAQDLRPYARGRYSRNGRYLVRGSYAPQQSARSL